jgi:endogenous inhibitor of DNA gyrase (YacG/DUF329 family)
VHTRPSCATRCKAVQHAAKLCSAHVAKLCYTLQSCATRSQVVQQSADAKFIVHTRPSCAARCKAVQHADDAKFTVHTQPNCATRCKAVQHAADAKFTVHTRLSCATRCKAGRVTANATQSPERLFVLWVMHRPWPNQILYVANCNNTWVQAINHSIPCSATPLQPFLLDSW